MTIRERIGLFSITLITFSFFSFQIQAEDLFSRAQKQCLALGYSKGSDDYGRCINEKLTQSSEKLTQSSEKLTQSSEKLTQSRLKDPDPSRIAAIKKHLDEGNAKGLSDVIQAIVVGSAVAVGTGVLVDGVAKGVTNGFRASPATNSGGGAKFGFPLKPYYGESSPNIINPPGQFFIPLQ
jgi:hypothetical protein